jgi:hypothetical protein
VGHCAAEGDYLQATQYMPINGLQIPSGVANTVDAHYNSWLKEVNWTGKTPRNQWAENP